MQICVFGDSPDQDLEILFTPIFLYFSIFDHLVDSGADHPHNSLVADVVVDDLPGFIQLCAVGEDICSQFGLPELLEALDEFDHFFLWVMQRLVGNGGLGFGLFYQLWLGVVHLWFNVLDGREKFWGGILCLEIHNYYIYSSVISCFWVDFIVWGNVLIRKKYLHFFIVWTFNSLLSYFGWKKMCFWGCECRLQIQSWSFCYFRRWFEPSCIF